MADYDSGKKYIELIGATLLLPEENQERFTPVENGRILLEDGRFSYVGPAGRPYEDNKRSLDLRDQDIESYDYSGRLILPPFANTHCHLGMSIFRNSPSRYSLEDWLNKWIFPLEEHLDYEIVRIATALSLTELTQSGVGAVADMYFFEDAVVESVLESGLRANIALGMKETDEKGHHYFDEERAKDFLSRVKVYEEQIKTSLEVHSLYLYPKEFYKDLALTAREFNLPIQMHLAETKTEVNGIEEKFAMSPVEALMALDLVQPDAIYAHCVHLTEKDLDLLKDKEVYLAHNPASNAKLASGMLKAKPMADRNLNLTLGTDGAGSNDQLNFFHDLRLASFYEKLSEENPLAGDAETWLYRATVKGYEALGFGDSAYFKIGEKADFLIYNPNVPGSGPYGSKSDPYSVLVYSGSPRGVEGLVVNGETVMWDYKHTRVDENLILREAGVAQEKLFSYQNN